MKHLQRIATLALIAALLSLAPSIAFADDDWGAEETDERRQEIIHRYQRILERRPVEGAVLDRLLQEVGGGRAFDRLIQEYEARADDEPDSFAIAVILGHLYKRASRIDDAVASYNRAAELDPDSQIPVVSMADALYRAGRYDEARMTYERALELVRDRYDRQDVLFALADIALSTRDFDLAADYFMRIIELDPRDTYIRTQLADTLVEHGRYEEAIAQYEAILDLSSRDTRQRALTLGSIGDVLVEIGQIDDAAERYRQAQRLVSRGSWLWTDLERRVIDAYRAGGDLEALVAQYEDDWRRPNFDQMRILTELYEEIGRLDDALDMARRAVGDNRRSIDARLDLIRILERFGDMDGAIEQYEALVDLSDEPAHGFRLAQLYIQQGDEEQAIETFERLERLYRRRPTVLAQLADQYTRWGYSDRALSLFEELVDREPDNPDHLVTYGALLFMEGRRDEALDVWSEILDAVDDPATAYAILGRVYSGHGLVDLSIDAYENALQADPTDEIGLMELAEVYENASRYTEALETWSRLAESGSDHRTRSQARARIVTIYQQQGVLPDRMSELAARLEAHPDDAAAAYLLAEASVQQGDWLGAELIYLGLLELDDQDVETLLPLSAIYEGQNRLGEAIELLERLAELDPDAAWDYLDTIVDLALRLFDDQRAVEFADRAVALNPDDARGYVRLGQVYRRAQLPERAAAAFEEALRLDARAHHVAFELAEVKVSLGLQQEAVEVLRQVVRQSRDERDVLRAGLRVIQLQQAVGGLDALLADWAGLAHRPNLEWVGRRLAVELVARLTEPLAHALVFGGATERDEALQSLQTLSPRASAALIPTLVEADTALRLEAVRLLSRLLLVDTTVEAVIPGLVRAIDDDDLRVRTAAVVALGLSHHDDGIDALSRAILDRDPTVRCTAAWALGQLGGDRVVDALLALLDGDPDSEVRAQAAISLGLLEAQSAVDRLLASTYSQSAIVRQSSLWALGALSEPRARDIVLLSAREGRRDEKNVAVWSLGNFEPENIVVRILLGAFWGESDAIRRTAGMSLRALSNREEGFIPNTAVLPIGPVGSGQSIGSFSLILAPDDGVDPAAMLVVLIPSRINELPSISATLFDDFGTVFEQELSDLLTSEDTSAVIRVLADLNSRPNHMGLGLLTADLDQQPDASTSEAALEQIGQRLLPSLRSLLDSPLAPVRASAAAAIGRIAAVGDPVAEALVDVLGDTDQIARRQAAAALARIGEDDVLADLMPLVDDDDCAVQAAAVHGATRLARDEALSSLLDQLGGGDCRLVWPAAAQGLVENADSGGADRLLELLARSDADTRADVARALTQVDTPAARRILETLATDQSATVRQTAASPDSE